MSAYDASAHAAPAHEGAVPAGTVEPTPSLPTPQSTVVGDKHDDPNLRVDERAVPDLLARESELTGDVSPGVARVEAISAVITTWDRIILFIGAFLVAYAYGLDGTLRYTYQPYATGNFTSDGAHSLLSTINVLRSVIAAAAQPTAAKIADVFGRAELVAISIVFYTVGTIIEAASNSVAAFSAGAVLYQVGYTLVIFLIEVIIGDVTSTRSRLFFSYIPALPFIINTWATGPIAESMIGKMAEKSYRWRWGIGMWAIIYPVAALPLMIQLIIIARRAKKQGLLVNFKTPFQHRGFIGLSKDLFWQLDVVGIILLIAVFALILAPLTIAGGFAEKWKQGYIIAPIVVGFVCIPIFVFWELWAPHPLVPFRLLKDRGVWAALFIAMFLNFSWYLQGDYLYTVMVVAFDFSISGANRATQLYSFVSVITGTIVGLIVFYVRRLKYFIVFGTFAFMAAFGMLIHYRGDPTGSHASKSGAIGAQILLGFAGGLFPYTTQASIQAGVAHEHLAIVTGLYLATYNIGSALGSSVSGAIWTQVLPKQLGERLAFTGNATLPAAIYGNPLVTAIQFPIGSPERTAIIGAYQHVQRLLCITGICLVVPLIVFALLLRNPKLSERQNLVENEVPGEIVEKPTHVVASKPFGIGKLKFWQSARV